MDYYCIITKDRVPCYTRAKTAKDAIKYAHRYYHGIQKIIETAIDKMDTYEEAITLYNTIILNMMIKLKQFTPLEIFCMAEIR